MRVGWSGERWTMHYVTDAVYVADHTIRVRFETGEVKVVDLGPHLDGPISGPLKDPPYLCSVKVNRDIDTVTWSNSTDFSPDSLCEAGKAMDQ